MNVRGIKRGILQVCLRHLLIFGFCSLAADAVAQMLVPQHIDSLVRRMNSTAKIAQISARTLYDTADNDSLGIPGMKMLDGPHGIHAKGCTSFPTGIAVAATWDRQTAWDVGQAMAEEFWSHGEDIGLAPCIDISLDPRGGRTAESAGEDPYISGQTGAWFIRGFQQLPVMACLKHFEIEGKQAYRTTCNEIIAERDLMEHFGYNFRTAIQEGLPLSLMSSYNLVNGIQGNENRHLQTTILRSRWGYPFLAMSDWIAVKDGDRALKAGTDLCMGSMHFKSQLPRDLSNGLITEADLDTAVRRVLLSKYASGLISYRPSPAISYLDTKEHQDICREAARKSIVLLRNQSVQGRTLLPLGSNARIALIGPNATTSNLNCYGSSETFPSYATSIRDGLETKTSQLTICQGCSIDAEISGGREEALKAAKEADFVVFAGGIDKTIEGELIANIKVNDRQTTALPSAQQQLIKDIAAVNPNIIVVLQSGGILTLADCIDNIPSLVYAFYGGQEAGNAIADVLFGDYNPAGRLPVTMPADDSQLPEWNDTYYSDDFGTGYRWFDRKGIKPQFAFGHGLSYTTFSYSNLKIIPLASVNAAAQRAPYKQMHASKMQAAMPSVPTNAPYSFYSDSRLAAYVTQEMSEENTMSGNLQAEGASVSLPAGTPLLVTADITNTGSKEGEEVAQLYLTNHTEEHYVPVKELRGYERISLQPGETSSVYFFLNAEDFYFWNTETQAYEVTPATYSIAVGGASDNLPLTSSFTLTASAGRPDLKATGIFTHPRYPRTGDKVTFYTYVKNQGNAPLKASDSWNVIWTIDGKKVASAQINSASEQPVNDSLLPDANTLAPGEGTMIFATVNNWQPRLADQYLLSVQVDTGKKLTEWRTDNNGCSMLLQVDENPLWDSVETPAEAMPMQTNTLYDLTGRRVSGNHNPTINRQFPKGIYILNGKKIIIR
ncbi:MAG: glycoside hydrolase family 3 C-terminal domain-containing protein [Bacteroidaceae bacterium]|nr:glycoside hydrolase family 3 C-terminal domain-containing protein [Bacteroidaceae bacterium]